MHIKKSFRIFKYIPNGPRRSHTQTNNMLSSSSNEQVEHQQGENEPSAPQSFKIWISKIDINKYKKLANE